MEVVERWFEEPLNIFNGFYPTSYEHFGDRARDIEGCDYRLDGMFIGTFPGDPPVVQLVPVNLKSNSSKIRTTAASGKTQPRQSSTSKRPR
jgi:hypothetical protein